MRKSLVLLIALFLVSIFGSNVEAITKVDRASIESRVRAEYENDPMYIISLEENNGIEAEEMIQRLVDSEIEKSSGTRTSNVGQSIVVRRPFTYSLNVPVIKQSTSYWCGAASTLQVLYQLGKASQISGSTDDAKQATIWPSIQTSDGSSAIVYKVVNYLNNYVSTDKYSYKDGANFTNNIDFYESLEHSIDSSRAPILHARTEYLSYYNGKSSGHYIAVDGYQLDISSGGTIRDSVFLSDCNWTSTYRGIFQVSYDEVYDCLMPNNSSVQRYLIYHN